MRSSLRTAALLLALLAAPAFADVTHLTVRFRDAAGDLDAPADRARLQAIGAAARTGIGLATVTHDGAYQAALTPALSDDGARAALRRLRNAADVLYAEAHDASVPAAAAPRDRPSPRLARIIVKFREPTAVADALNDRPLAPDRVAQLAARAGAPLAFMRTMSWAGAHVVQLMTRLPQEEVEAMARAIEADPDVAWAQPDYLRVHTLVPNDPLYANQWHYQMAPGVPGGANLPNAWNRTTGWSGVRIAVLDTGALTNHPDLAGRFIGGYDFIFDWVYANDNEPPPPVGCPPGLLTGPCDNRDADASDPGDWTSVEDDAGLTYGGYLQNCGVFDSSWHGTHVAGTVGAATNNALGVAGVNWVSRIVPVRVLGKCGGYDADIADAIVWASGGTVSGVAANANPARVLNLSLGGGGACTGTPALQNAINDALTRNSVVVVSAGNSNADAANFSPASCNGVVTVAAVGRIGQRASYSNFGSVVEIAAPGGSDGETVLSTLNTGVTTPNPAGMTFVGYQGTSMAAPHVSGIVSLLLSIKPGLTPGQVTTALQAAARPFPTGTGRDCTTLICGAGIVNADQLLQTAIVGLAATTTTLVSDANPSTVGGAVTLTATVAAAPAATGTVTFTDDDVALAGCANVVLVGGSAQCATAALTPRTHRLRAVYSGSATHIPSDSAVLAQVVFALTPVPTTTALASSANPSNQGASVTFTATVTGIAPGGTLNFRSNGVSIAGCASVAVTGSGDTRGGVCTTSALAAGTFAIDVLYSGDTHNQASGAPLTQGVIAANACARFNDVAASDPFCDEVQWMLNRLITTGCAIVDYCPSSPVTRLAMAAFMQREGGVLGSFDVPLVAGFITLNLSTPKITCFDPARNFAVTGHPRRVQLRSFANVFLPSASTTVTVEHVYSVNGGTTWNTLPTFNTVGQSIYAGRAPGDDQTMNLAASMDLDVGTSYLFGLRLTATPGASSVGLYCAVQARIVNRNGASPPY